ncbi:hypothetical protein GN956_G10143 [Arapaima gigas]
MPEILTQGLKTDEKCPPEMHGTTAAPQTLGGDDRRDEEKEEEEEHKVGSALLESSTLPYRGGKEEIASARSEKGERESVGSDLLLSGQESRTESARELSPQQKAAEDRWTVGEKERVKKTHKKGDQVELEVNEEENLTNSMPEKAFQVFNTNVTIRRSSNLCESLVDSRTHWEKDPENYPFLGTHGTPPDGYYHDYAKREAPSSCEQHYCCCCGDRDVLKVGVSVFTAALLFPLLVWGGYVFLPFDAPLLDSAPLRLIYTLRCSVFAAVPIVLGVLVLGVSRLRLCSVKSPADGEVEPREVAIHRCYVSDSMSLFLLYFLQLAVMASFLRQELLKLVPLLTIVFAFGRLIYWLAAALGSSVRGVGFGMSFLPILAMLGANLYFIFMTDAGDSIFAMEAPPTPKPPAPPRQRFWG